MSAGRRDNSAAAVRSEGSTRIPTTTAVKNNAPAGANHPANKTASSAIGTRLRRRFSKIFHPESADTGFDTLGPPAVAAGTRGNSHGAICQSPRIHLYRRLTSAGYADG